MSAPGGRDDVVAALQAERVDALTQVRDLERVIAGVVAATAGANTDDEHDPEGATIAFERAQASAVRDRQLARVREVDEALARVEAGTFGVCDRCGGPIAVGRLLARPTATLCITCAGAPPRASRYHHAAPRTPPRGGG